jgi:hypothetical protein
MAVELLRVTNRSTGEALSRYLRRRTNICLLVAADSDKNCELTSSSRLLCGGPPREASSNRQGQAESEAGKSAERTRNDWRDNKA